MLGASPQEAPGEVWTTAASADTLARYTTAGGWETLPKPIAAAGGPIPELEPPQGAGAGRAAPGGSRRAAAASGGRPILVVRDPGGAPREAPEPEEGILEPGESLYPTEGGGALLAAVDQPGGKAGAYVVPEGQAFVLRFDGGSWSREEICAGTAPG